MTSDFTMEVFYFLLKEDFFLLHLVSLLGTKNWKTISDHLQNLFPGRGKNFRDLKNRLFYFIAGGVTQGLKLL